MKKEKLNSALKKYLHTEIEERNKQLEECKYLAFKIWDVICTMRDDFSPHSIQLYVSDSNIILNCYPYESGKTFSFSSNHSEVLHIISIIAENSDIKGKMFFQPNNLQLTFSYD